MNQYIKIEDFEQELHQRNFQKVYEIIILKTYDLISELIKEKKIDIPINLKDTSCDNIFHISRILTENSISFEYLIALLDELQNWDTDPLDPSLPDIETPKIEQYIRFYNYSINEYQNYLKLKKELQGKDFEQEKQKKIDTLISTFKSMMDYKKKAYSETWNFREWVHEIDCHYHVYHELLKDALSLAYEGVIDVDIINYGYDTINADEIEILKYLDDLNHILNEKDDNYENHAYDYIDIVLKEGQTYSDILHDKEKQLIAIMKEMLDDIHVAYEKDELYYLCNLISEHYPYYEQNLISLRASLSNPEYTMIYKIDQLESTYQYFKKDYKNREENMRKYQKEMKDFEMLKNKFDML